MALDTRSYAARYFSLAIDGQECGMLRSVDGGGIKGELIAQQVGGQPHRIKHINNPVAEPVTIQAAMTMTKAFYDWIDASWAGRTARRNGAITFYDADFNPTFEYSFSEALILETSFPPFDAAMGKDAAFMTVKFQPETAENKFSPGGGKPRSLQNVLQKNFSSSNFRFELDGIEGKWVHKIDPITVKQNVKPMTCGPDWMYQLEPTSLEFPNLTVYCGMAQASGFYDWHKSFVINGKNGPEDEKNGSITYMNPTFQKDLLTIDLFRVGILNIVQEKTDAGGEPNIKRCKVELYVEEMRFKYLDDMR